jgi:hypothetical protein
MKKIIRKVSDFLKDDANRNLRSEIIEDVRKNVENVNYTAKRVLNPVREVLEIAGRRMKGPVSLPYRIVPAYIERRRRLKGTDNLVEKEASLLDELESKIYTMGGELRVDVKPGDFKNYQKNKVGHGIGRAGNWLVNTAQVLIYLNNPVMLTLLATANIVTAGRAYRKYRKFHQNKFKVIESKDGKTGINFGEDGNKDSLEDRC